MARDGDEPASSQSGEEEEDEARPLCSDKGRRPALTFCFLSGRRTRRRALLQKSRLQTFLLPTATRRTRRGWTSKEAVAKRTPTCPVRAAWVRALWRRADNDAASPPHPSPPHPSAATLCIDCQKHDVYATQFRAMFVRNCLVSRTERLREGGGESGAVFYSVRCADCLTEVAVRDEEEVYHFFNILATVRVRNTVQLCAASPSHCAFPLGWLTTSPRM